MRYFITLLLFLTSCDLKTVKDEEISLYVNSTPSGAAIYMDNEDTGFSTPHSFKNLDEGSIAVKLVLNSDYPEFNQIIDLEFGDNKTINPTITAFWEHNWSGNVTINDTSTFELPFGDLTVPGIVNASITISYQWTNLVAQNSFGNGKLRFNGFEIGQFNVQENVLIINQSALVRNSIGKLVIDNSGSTIAGLKVTSVILGITQ